ncbi:MAG: hypothetical protein HRT80_02600 [Henriciella sp.]|nr:hypothetical protein [Henriciella sp.]
MTSDRNNGRNTDGTFAKGNMGRPKGARHKSTLATLALIDGEAEALTCKAIELALSGDVTALKLCLERLAPPRKETPVQFDLPPLEGAAAAVAAFQSILGGVANGNLTPSEASKLAVLVEGYRKALETEEFEHRLDALEEREA